MGDSGFDNFGCQYDGMSRVVGYRKPVGNGSLMKKRLNFLPVMGSFSTTGMGVQNDMPGDPIGFLHPDNGLAVSFLLQS
jgi:hypothetical protein